MGNNGTGDCGSPPQPFVCQPGATGPGVLDGSVYLYQYAADLTAFAGVTCITGDLWMNASPLVDFTGFESLVAVGGNIGIVNNPALTSLKGLDNLKSATSLSIDNNPNLTSLAALANLRSLAQMPYIFHNAALPACWAERVATQVGLFCSCYQNNGAETCP
jgi:hypothetical protein